MSIALWTCMLAQPSYFVPVWLSHNSVDLCLPLGAGGVLEETQGGCSLPVQRTGGLGPQAFHPCTGETDIKKKKTVWFVQFLQKDNKWHQRAAGNKRKRTNTKQENTIYLYLSLKPYGHMAVYFTLQLTCIPHWSCTVHWSNSFRHIFCRTWGFPLSPPLRSPMATSGGSCWPTAWNTTR